MNAKYFSSDPRPAVAAKPGRSILVEPSLRRAHRLTSMVFTSTVTANFVAMIWGPPPALITYSPLPPLLILLLTGLSMLVRHQLRGRRAAYPLNVGR